MWTRHIWLLVSLLMAVRVFVPCEGLLWIKLLAVGGLQGWPWLPQPSCCWLRSYSWCPPRSGLPVSLSALGHPDGDGALDNFSVLCLYPYYGLRFTFFPLRASHLYSRASFWSKEKGNLIHFSFHFCWNSFNPLSHNVDSSDVWGRVLNGKEWAEKATET